MRLLRLRKRIETNACNLDSWLDLCHYLCRGSRDWINVMNFEDVVLRGMFFAFLSTVVIIMGLSVYAGSLEKTCETKANEVQSATNVAYKNQLLKDECFHG